MDGPGRGGGGGGGGGGIICSTMDGPVGPVIAWTIYGVTAPSNALRSNLDTLSY